MCRDAEDSIIQLDDNWTPVKTIALERRIREEGGCTHGDGIIAPEN